MMYSHRQFEAAQQQAVSERQQALQTELNADPAITSARAKLRQAEEDLQYYRTHHDALNALDAQKAVSASKREVTDAIALHNRNLRQAQLEEQKQTERREQETQQAKVAAEQEAEAKAQYKPFFLQSGGTESEFNAAWPGIWQKELEERTAQQMAATHRSLRQQRYSL